MDVTKIACQLPQAAGMISGIFVAASLDLDADGRAWVRAMKPAAIEVER